MGRKAYTFSLYEPGVMVLRRDVNVKIWCFIKAKFCVTSSMEQVGQKFNKHLLNK